MGTFIRPVLVFRARVQKLKHKLFTPDLKKARRVDPPGFFSLWFKRNVWDFWMITLRVVRLDPGVSL